MIDTAPKIVKKKLLKKFNTDLPEEVKLVGSVKTFKRNLYEFDRMSYFNVALSRTVMI